MWIILFLIIANGMFAMSEIAIVTARKHRLKAEAESGNRNASIALGLAENPDAFLSTIQVGITLINILAGVFGEASITRELEPVVRTLPVVGAYSQAVSQGLVVLGITYLTLVMGELVPKRIGLAYAETVSMRMARPITLLSRISAPLIWLLGVSSTLLLKLLPLQPAPESGVTVEEVQSLMEQGRESGVFDPINEEMVGQIFRLGEIRVDELMTPRPNVVYLDVNQSDEQIRQTIIENRHSRYPVAQGDEDNVIGFVMARDLLAQALSGQPIALQSLLHPMLIVPEGLPVLQMLERFKEQKAQMALVIDEYGEMQGLITLNDLLEEIVGDIPEAGDPTDPQAMQQDDGTWLIDGMLPTEDFRELFKLESLPGEKDGYYYTLGGFVMFFLGRVPKEGEHFEWGRFRLRVVDMDSNRVDKVMLTSLPSLDPQAREQEEA